MAVYFENYKVYKLDIGTYIELPVT